MEQEDFKHFVSDKKCASSTTTPHKSLTFSPSQETLHNLLPASIVMEESTSAPEVGRPSVSAQGDLGQSTNPQGSLVINSDKEGLRHSSSSQMDSIHSTSNKVRVRHSPSPSSDCRHPPSDQDGFKTPLSVKNDPRATIITQGSLTLSTSLMESLISSASHRENPQTSLSLQRSHRPSISIQTPLLYDKGEGVYLRPCPTPSPDEVLGHSSFCQIGHRSSKPRTSRLRQDPSEGGQFRPSCTQEEALRQSPSLQ